MDATDARLLDLLQQGLPLVARPFADLAAQLGISERDVISRIERLKSDSVIRQIGAIFDSAALGYTSALVAFLVDGPALDRAAGIVSAHSGVSHCYSRDADYNLWFTITVPPEGDVETEVRALAGAGDVEDYLVLPAVKVFKVGVFLPMSDFPRPSQRQPASSRRESVELSERDRAAIRALQSELPLVEQPFAELASRIGIEESGMLDLARQYLERGIMRRFAAVLRHHRAGYASNAMVCWRVEPERVDEIGRKLASDASVSHCYERPVSTKWPYALYTMVHARSADELNAAIVRMAEAASSDHVVLRSLKEYKKSRVSYL